MDGAPPLQRASAANFTNSLCKGAVVVKANCHSQGIGKTMVKEASKLVLQPVAIKRLFPLISSAIAPMHLPITRLSATRLEFQS